MKGSKDVRDEVSYNYEELYGLRIQDLILEQPTKALFIQLIFIKYVLIYSLSLFFSVLQSLLNDKTFNATWYIA